MAKSTSVGEIKALVERIEEAFALAGAKGPAADFRRLASTMEGHEDETIDQFVDQTLALLQLAKRGGTHEEVLDESTPAVDRYVQSLLEAGENKDEFEAALGLLKNDRQIGKSQLDLIANGFLNKPTGGTHRFQFKTADAAYKAIRRVFVERAQDESKARIIKRMTG